MSNVLQILSENYSGQTVNITFQPLDGEVVKLTDVTLPYNFINDTFDGDYILFFPEYNLTHKLTIPNPGPPQSRCRCAEFSCFSLIGSPCKVSYLNCQGQQRNVSMISGQIFKDCVRLKSYDEKIKNVTINLYNYCDKTSDCVELTPPPTNTQTPTNTPTNTQTPTMTPTNTQTPTNTPMNTQTPTPSPTQTSIPQNLSNILLFFDNQSLNSFDINTQTINEVLGYPQNENFDGVCFNLNYVYVFSKIFLKLKRYTILSFNPFEVDLNSAIEYDVPPINWSGKISLVGDNKILLDTQVVNLSYVIYEIIGEQLVEFSRKIDTQGSILTLHTETSPIREISFGSFFKQRIYLTESESIEEISGLYLSQPSLSGVFFYNWNQVETEINLVSSSGYIQKIQKKYPYTTTTVGQINSTSIKSISQIYGQEYYNEYFNSPIYLSGITSGLIYTLSNNSFDFLYGTYVSGLTYNKSRKNSYPIYPSINVNGIPLPNYETKFKVVNFEDFSSSQFWRYWNNILSFATVSQYSSAFNYEPIDYQFSEIDDITPETIPNFSGNIKIRIDVSKLVWDLRTSDEILFERINFIINKIESLPSLSNLGFTISCDVFYWTETNIFDNMSITQYEDYYEDFGGIFTYSGYHIGILWNNLTYANGITNSTGGFYIQIAGGNSNFVNTTEIWDTFVHEVGHALSIIHTFDCYWKDVYSELEYDYLDNTDDSIYGCLECGYYTPYLNEYVGTESEGCTSIMGYGKFATNECNSPSNVESSLDPSYKIFNTESPTSFFENDNKNISYIDFLENGEIGQNDLDYILVTVGNNSANNLTNVIDSILIINEEGEELEILSPRLNNPNPIILNISSQELSGIFNYENQSGFGIKLDREKIADGNTNWNLGSYGITVSFYTISGNNIISRKPKNYFTTYNSTEIQVPALYTTRASRLNSYEYTILNFYLQYVSGNYFNL
jgi:hypothetical protein